MTEAHRVCAFALISLGAYDVVLKYAISQCGKSTHSTYLCSFEQIKGAVTFGLLYTVVSAA